MAEEKDIIEEGLENEDSVRQEEPAQKKSKKEKQKSGKRGKRGRYVNPHASQEPINVEPLKNEEGEYVCPYCSKVVSEDALNCPHCRRAIRIKHLSSQYDSGDPFIALLSFFIPVIGAILFFYWRKTKPRNSKMAAIGTLVFIVIFTVLIISVRPT